MTTVSDRLAFPVPVEVSQILATCPNFIVAGDLKELIDLACRDEVNGWHEVSYDVPGEGPIVEARVCRVRNGIAANYIDPYMRRRDPDCMVIGDDRPTNKARYVDRFGSTFDSVRQKTFDWLAQQELCLFPFIAGEVGRGLQAMVVAPANAGFFALALGLLQGIIRSDDLPDGFSPKAIIYVAPPFRHTHFEGKQVVVHNRTNGLHELFSYNLYPGPSAKKGIYGVLLNLGEQEGWVTAHCSTVQVVTPYDNTVTIMHEGASGGGKSEMLEHVHRQTDGRLLLGKNLIDGDERFLTLARGCDLKPVTDDMALCHPSLQGDDQKLALMDAEQAWFIRVNHIDRYGTDPHLEKLTVHPPEPLLFLNIEAMPGATALIWEHIMDAPGQPCPNPRVVLSRKSVPNVVDGAVTVDIRSFGVRTPPCTKANPSYGILGVFHVLPPALAWLWRLTAPRGHANPSIIGQDGLSSEGVGSYWPFATGRRVDQANLLLEQIRKTTRMAFVLCPNQHIGAWKVGFMPQWIAREYLARRGGARFKPEQITPARCPLLGYTPKQVIVEGSLIPPVFIRVETQPEVGTETYDKGAELLYAFFKKQLSKFLEPDLLPLGKQIIDCCLANGSVQDYDALMPGK